MGARNALSVVGKWWTKIRGLAFGYGFPENIADVYSFLMAEFKPTDNIFIFGFSRGSYTARALCGFTRATTPANWTSPGVSETRLALRFPATHISSDCGKPSAR
jgi:hypothetical protein